MNWEQVSPGIWRGQYRDFKCHKIQGKARATSLRVDEHGDMIVDYEYSYVAIRAGEEGKTEHARYSGSDWEKIVQKIENSTQKTLF